MAKLFTVKQNDSHINFSMEKVASLPGKCKEAKDYSEFWVIRSTNGRESLYLARGYRNGHAAKASREVVGWYGSGKFHSGYTLTLQGTVELLVKTAWIYA